MLSDRRPILLTNARIIDPSRDLDLDGDLLIADGAIRDAKRGIGAAGVPEGTEVVDCRGRVAHLGLRIRHEQERQFSLCSRVGRIVLGRGAKLGPSSVEVLVPRRDDPLADFDEGRLLLETANHPE